MGKLTYDVRHRGAPTRNLELLCKRLLKRLLIGAWHHQNACEKPC